MRYLRKTLVALVLALIAITAQSATYSGNGNSGFGGSIGLGSLTLTDNGTTVSGTVNKGPNGFNDVLVLYIDSSAGGFSVVIRPVSPMAGTVCGRRFRASMAARIGA